MLRQTTLFMIEKISAVTVRVANIEASVRFFICLILMAMSFHLLVRCRLKSHTSEILRGESKPAWTLSGHFTGGLDGLRGERVQRCGGIAARHIDP
jgi:hypothetical protein